MPLLLPLMPPVGTTALCIGEAGIDTEAVGMPPAICEMGVTGAFEVALAAPEKPRPAPRSRSFAINRPMSLLGSIAEKNPPGAWLKRLMPCGRGGGGGSAGVVGEVGGAAAGGWAVGGGGGVGNGLVMSPGGNVV